jgi:hypothetical protein
MIMVVKRRMVTTFRELQEGGGGGEGEEKVVGSRGGLTRGVVGKDGMIAGFFRVLAK